MRGTIAWSYDLLEEKEKLLFRRLAVFTGGFTLDAAEGAIGETTAAMNRTTVDQATAGNENPGLNFKRLSTTDVLDGITSLIEQNLLMSKEQLNCQPRFRMLEVVREYALESLEESGEWDVMQRRHAEFFLALSEQAEPHLQAAKSGEWLKRLEDEHDNLRAALRWAIGNDRKLGQGLASAIWRFWLLHGHVREGCEYLDLFLSWGDVGAGDDVRTKMLLGAGFLHRLEASFDLARSLAEEGLALARQADDKRGVAFALYQLGLLALEDNVVEAGRLFGEGLAYAQDSGDKQMLALLFNGMGEFCRSQRDSGRAAEFYSHALELNREIGDLYRQATNLVNLGATALLQKNWKAAGLFYRDGLKISSNMSDVRGAIYCLEGVAATYWAARDPMRAAILLGAASASREAMSLPIEPTDQSLYNQHFALVSGLITEKSFTDAFEQGRRVKLDEAVIMALEESDSP